MILLMCDMNFHGRFDKMHQRVLQYTWVTNILICSVVAVVHNDNFTSVHSSYFQTEMLDHCYGNISITALIYFVLFEIKSNVSKVFEVSLLTLENSMIKIYLTLHADSLCIITFMYIGSDKTSIFRNIITPVGFRFTLTLISEIVLEKYVGSFVQIPDFNCCHGNKNSGSSE